MTADPPPETRPGHADDCAACRYEALPDEDRAGTDPTEARTHTRRPEPVLQPLPRWPAVVAFIGLIFVALTWRGAVFGLVGFVIMLPAVIAWGYLAAEWRAAERRWRAEHGAWTAEQTTVWRAARAKGESWYCPTCGDLSCANQHPETERPGSDGSGRRRAG